MGTVKTEAAWFDAKGAPCEPQVAVTGEIVESEDGVVLRRTYVDYTDEGDRAVGEVFSYDLELESLDSGYEWDVRHPETQEPVRDLATLKLALGGGLDAHEWRSKVANMLQLPSWRAAPTELKVEVYDWLVETRPER